MQNGHKLLYEICVAARTNINDKGIKGIKTQRQMIMDEEKTRVCTGKRN